MEGHFAMIDCDTASQPKKSHVAEYMGCVDPKSGMSEEAWLLKSAEAKAELEEDIMRNVIERARAGDTLAAEWLESRDLIDLPSGLA